MKSQNLPRYEKAKLEENSVLIFGFEPSYFHNLTCFCWSLVAHPQYSLVADEDVKKPTNKLYKKPNKRT